MTFSIDSRGDNGSACVTDAWKKLSKKYGGWRASPHSMEMGMNQADFFSNTNKGLDGAVVDTLSTLTRIAGLSAVSRSENLAFPLAAHGPSTFTSERAPCAGNI